MNTQTVELKAGYEINSYCAIHPEQDISVTYNQQSQEKLGGLIDAVIHPCCLCLAGAEAFGRANAERDAAEERAGEDI